MFCYSTIYINITSFIITTVIFIITNLFISNYSNFSQKSTLKAGFEVEDITKNNNSKMSEENITEPIEENVELNQKTIEEPEWALKIQKINLEAKINEGTTKEVMDEYIGHFEETPKEVGNIGLAAHNRGYKNNYFENLKKLQIGDEITYIYKGKEKNYKVSKISIIKDTDWSMLENTEENELTLITCVENEPEYRRCVKAEEIRKTNYKKSIDF